MSKKIMFQGTGSTVGKSLITAAICRILNDKGYNVAPFKSQNMSLNSYVTQDGKEMGRAQVVQAEAARIEPMVEMNPVLLKPTSDIGSQIILNGKVFNQLKASDYYRNKEYLMTEVIKAFRTLEEKYDIIVIEGAGSPAEINLRKNDIVNMGLAEAIDTPVVLIGDIDKGGVFASIYGTYMLLSSSEQKRIKGYIINKFRGDVTLLQPGIDMFYEKLPIPCLGVIPYSDFQIDDEDSVTTRFEKPKEGSIHIGVIRLPYMSNFTDFTALELEQDVSVKYLATKDDFEEIDLLIIPGSKSTIADRIYLQNSGLDEKIYRCHKKRTPIIGICGGYQILGKTIKDPFGVETERKEVNGLGLLNINTVLEEEKKTIQRTGQILVNFDNGGKTQGKNVEGYEIHMGKTEHLDNESDFILLEEGLYDGCVNQEGTVFGTYLHGIFDSHEFREALLEPIRRKKGLNLNPSRHYRELKEEAYDYLGKVVNESLDIEAIMNIIESSN
ncbi:adenosylcobyric acid synthase (glutamine-hydrolysing) [Natranaerovirga pectinivora]|uniref:Cobyric acid synthase n=1 Tax=Natranaerovirga pectinivora TaxID=682400 RepID=A0A4R3MMK2_9FIRM|nr:cobyric acid synthase [Natranaerovirga pectinivora]TCT15523.1 adenosylcobyric acid synthase (glutamine-hydrolysing) [Natranaerovirga pectinivora]